MIIIIKQILAKELDIPLDRLCSRPQKMFYLDYVRGKCDFETAEKEIYKIYNQRLEEYKKKSNKTIKSQ